MVLIHENAVVMLTTSVTATTGMLSVLPNAAMARTNMSSLFSVLS